MPSELRPRVICRCLGVASPRIFAAVRSERLTSVAAVTKSVRAGGGCGLCHPEIEEILAEVRGEPVDVSLVLENQLMCQQETLARIEAALASLLAPRLAAHRARIGDVTVVGLCVIVRLAGSVEAEDARAVAPLLRDYVCEDLEVEVRVESES
jgi:NifU-like protein